MSASFFANFLIFVVTGAYTLFKVILGTSPTGMLATDLILGGYILTFAIFFIYVELFAETDEQEQIRLRSVSSAQWYVRVINQTNLALMWVWLNFGVTAIFVSLLVYHILILCWDAIVLRDPNYMTTNPTNEMQITFHDFISFALYLVILSVYYNYSSMGSEMTNAWDNGYFEIEDARQLIVLSIALAGAALAGVWNMTVAWNKMPIDFRSLFSAARRR